MSPGSGPIRILHVEDDTDFADLAGTFLTREDKRFEIETAHNVSEGMDLLPQSDLKKESGTDQYSGHRDG